MKTKFEITLEQIKEKLVKIQKILWIIGRHAFTVILVLILIDILFSGILFYKYVYLAENKKPNFSSTVFQFKDSSYQKVLSNWIDRDKELQDFMQKNYANPF